MITANEMRKLLKKEFGIKSDLELDIALKKKGGIKIAIFTDEIPKRDGENAQALA